MNRTLLSAALLGALLVPGCDDAVTETPPDLQHAVDASVPPDLRKPRDLSIPLDESVPPDESMPPDEAMPVDAAGVCAVRVPAPDKSAGQVGANGGAVGNDLACKAGDEIVGVAVAMSDGMTSNGGRSAVGLQIACAAVTTSMGGPAVGKETPTEIRGTGMFGWTPATTTKVARCPAGWVVSGLKASRGKSLNLFLDVTITCAEIGPSGNTTGNTKTIYVDGSLMDATMYDDVQCPAGQVVRRMGTRIGAGFDAATVYCATPGCEP